MTFKPRLYLVILSISYGITHDSIFITFAFMTMFCYSKSRLYTNFNITFYEKAIYIINVDPYQNNQEPRTISFLNIRMFFIALC